ncbi:hypothetical protein GA0116948_10952 [Chitinophaga costaii]|uniref:Uncharacterized protein n=1 Tax=Chitinophaga costaii TaxID=1335309 RepID=A0A1C4EN12_9BACT|nr:hypothetical protein GA0116948_10952 [Chitinophaga costaii]
MKWLPVAAVKKSQPPFQGLAEASTVEMLLGKNFLGRLFRDAERQMGIHWIIN